MDGGSTSYYAGFGQNKNALIMTVLVSLRVGRGGVCIIFYYLNKQSNAKYFKEVKLKNMNKVKKKIQTKQLTLSSLLMSTCKKNIWHMC